MMNDEERKESASNKRWGLRLKEGSGAPSTSVQLELHEVDAN